MSNQVRLSSKLAADEECNGLDALAGTLRDNPDQVVAAIVWLTVDTVTWKREDHSRTPRVEIKRIEPIGAVDAVPQAVIDLAAELYQNRLNKTPLPFDVVDVIEGGYVNPADRE